MNINALKIISFLSLRRNVQYQYFVFVIRKLLISKDENLVQFMIFLKLMLTDTVLLSNIYICFSYYQT